MTHAEPLDSLRRRTSEKWTEHPSDVLPMFVAEMDYPLARAIAEALHAAVERSDTGYVNPRDTGAAEAFAGFARDAWGWSPDPALFGITTDVSVVIVETLRRLSAPGDGVIITPPVYPPFFDLIPEAGARVVEVPLLDDGSTYALDLAGIDRALAAGARGVLLCNPHNPLGLVHTRGELEELARIVERHGAFVVSDEIHAPLVHPGVEFTPYLTVSDAAREHAIAAESGSKAFNLAGLKAAFIVPASERMADVVRGLPDEVTFRTGLFGLMATRAGFADSREWLADTLAAITANVDLLERLLASELPLARLRRPSASYLAWIDLSAYGWGDDPAQHILEHARVALSNGPTFGREGVGHVRLNLACSPELLTEAITRIAALTRP
ncbi:aminotransferase class I/II-fold pyridoxal phosphate-dependent enzyme [Protaetiibacter sp. SSC-01]|uniref:MalY/PatB family protein n=1 Tax=Protaetiibacter sp. SSC-01 TaxID=2759943 RepID=UPI001656B6FD|nr:aminotransferase class I/II-fold pyridoxal phosphate-dependent enzyme [Protaetiibacter sp. SSC-01]QNO38954.1 aminotransferase class I/II-fold pyridoxal phosphate-dependent enzyme [Protaetiibacter sp. SSC-01]